MARALRLARVAALPLVLTLGAAGCDAQQPWPLWEAYTQHFVDPQGRVIDRSAGDRTTSEGQSYAMFFALVDNDKAHFDRLLRWTEANLAGGDLTLRLPAWCWGRSASGEWKTLDDNSASDADVWMAYTLMEAGRLWHDPRYEKLGRFLAERIAREEVVLIPDFGSALAPGPRGFHLDSDAYILNPSYLPLPLLTGLSKTMPQGPWAAVLGSMPQLLAPEVGHGFAMDWVLAGPTGVHPAPPPAQTSAGAREPQAAGSYDAIRVYLWLGMADPGTPGERTLLAQVPGMAASMHRSMTPPLEVDAQGTVLHSESPVGFSASVVPYLMAVGMRAEAKAQQDRMTAAKDPATGLYGRPGEYYDENLALFSTGWSEQRFRFDRDGRLHVKWK